MVSKHLTKKGILLKLTIVIGMFFLFSCLPVAPITSPRVKAVVSPSISVGYHNYYYHIKYECKKCSLDDSTNEWISGIRDYYLGPNTSLNEENFAIKLRPRFGIARRIEISGIIYPFFPYFTGGELNIKCAIFDFGYNNMLFNNFAGAVYLGGIGFFDEHSNSERNLWLGSIFSTYNKENIYGDLEIVVSNSIKYDLKIINVAYQQLVGIKNYSLDLGLGLIFTTLEDKRLEVSAGIIFSQPIAKETYYQMFNYYTQPENPTQISYYSSPFYFYLGIGYLFGKW